MRGNGKRRASEKYQQRSAQPGEWSSCRDDAAARMLLLLPGGPFCCCRDDAAAAVGMMQGRQRSPSHQKLKLFPAKCTNVTLHPPFWDKTAADTGVFFTLTSYVLSKLKKVAWHSTLDEKKLPPGFFHSNKISSTIHIKWKKSHLSLC